MNIPFLFIKKVSDKYLFLSKVAEHWKLHILLSLFSYPIILTTGNLECTSFSVIYISFMHLIPRCGCCFCLYSILHFVCPCLYLSRNLDTGTSCFLQDSILFSAKWSSNLPNFYFRILFLSRQAVYYVRNFLFTS